MILEIKTYRLRLDNSICDIVRFKTPNNLFEIDGVTPKPKEWIDKVFPYLYAVTYCHINPNDQVDRKLFLYCNPNKEKAEVGAHEIEISEFNVTPKKLYNMFKDENYKQNIVVAHLDNLEYCIPNIVKRDKILNDGETRAMIHNLQEDKYPESMKNKLAAYNWADRPENYVPTLEECGRVTGLKMNELYPVEVTFPNGYKGQFIVDDLMLVHEV